MKKFLSLTHLATLLLLGYGLLGAAALRGAPDFGGLLGRANPKMGLGLMGNLASSVTIYADHMSGDQRTGTMNLVDNVLVRFGDISVTCDRASYDRDSGDVHAEGNVEIISLTGGSWKGDSIDFNHKTGEGLIGAGVLRFGEFTIEADSYSHDDDGVFNARNATFTTCTNEQDHWHWSIKGTARYKDKEFVEMRDAVPRFMGIPFFYVPYFYRDLNTQYGWRIMPGYTSKWGGYLLTSYLYPVAGSLESGRFLHARTSMDIRTNYGVAVGQSFGWNTEKFNQKGKIAFYYAYHNDDQKSEDINWQSDYDKHRWSLSLDERLEFSPRDTLTIEGEVVSDSQFREDYNEFSVRASSQPIGIVNYEHRENRWVAGLNVMGPLDSFYAGVKHLPEFKLNILPQEILGISRLYYESQTSAGYYMRQPAKYGTSYYTDARGQMIYRYQTSNWAYYDAGRVDTRHIFRRPYELVDGVTLTPRLGWRGTFYSDSINGDSQVRSLPELGLRLKSRYWQDFQRYRHSFTPYIDFTYVPASRTKADKMNFAFDNTDRAYEWRDRFGADGIAPTHRYAGFRFGTKNFLQRRTPNGLTKLVDVDLYGIFVLQSEDEWVRWWHRDQIAKRGQWDATPAHRVKTDRGFRVIGVNGSYQPFSNFEIANDFQYDPKKTSLAIWDINMRYSLPRFTVYAGYLMRGHDVYDYYWQDRVSSKVIYGGFIHRLCDTISWSLFARYDYVISDLEEIGGFLQYNLDCISFRFNASYLPEYTSEDGYKHDSDTRVSVSAWLRAFPTPPTERWMTWGNLEHDRAIDLN